MRVTLLPLVAAILFGCSAPSSGLDGDWGADPTPQDNGGTDSGGKDSGGGAQDGGGPASDSGSSVVDAAKPIDAGADAADAGNLCIKGAAAPNSGHHKAGQDCMGCHDGLSSNLKWTIAGTVYAAANSTTAVDGANIEIIDSKQKKVVLVTSTNGNFYTTDTFTFPVKVRGTKCPSDMKMNANVTTGSCNSNSCHSSGARIYVP